MLRPVFRPSHDTVPSIRTLTPTRSFNVSRTVSTPSSMKLIGLTWMPTNFSAGSGFVSLMSSSSLR